MLQLTEQLEKSLGNLEHMKTTIVSMQTEIEALRQSSARLGDEKSKLEIAFTDSATKHEHEMKRMVSAN